MYIYIYFVTIKHISIQTYYLNDYDYSSTIWDMYKQKRKTSDKRFKSQDLKRMMKRCPQDFIYI